MAAASLFAGLPVAGSPDETTELLLARPGVRIERIVSTGQSSPPGFWYDQPDDEWVAVLSGAARLELADGTMVDLRPGDHLLIPARRRHRVAWTDPATATVWLAVHIAPGG